jgi:hypothetical protein
MGTVTTGFSRATRGIALNDKELVVLVIFARCRGEFIRDNRVDFVDLLNAARRFFGFSGRLSRFASRRALME